MRGRVSIHRTPLSASVSRHSCYPRSPLANSTCLWTATFNTISGFNIAVLNTTDAAATPTVTAGGFFIVNLFLAVLFDEFLTAKSVDKAVKAMSNRRPSSEGGGVPPSPPPSPPPSRAGAKTELAKGGGKASRAAASKAGANGSTRAAGKRDEEVKALLLAAHGDSRSDGPSPANGKTVTGGVCRGVAESSWLSNASTLLVLVNFVLMCMPYEVATQRMLQPWNSLRRQWPRVAV